MSSQRSYHTATLLANGKVLIAGGSGNNGATTSSAQLYDPATGSFSATGNMTVSRDFHTATLLAASGKVLITGGRTSSGSGYTDVSSAEIYDPTTGTFTAASPMSTGRYGHTAVLFNGTVLISGGSNNGGTSALATAELYDGTTGAYIGTTTNSLAKGRQYFTSTVIGGSVLAAGGQNGSTPLSSSELYQGAGFSTGAAMTAARSAHTATLLNNGKVLIVGGQGSNGTSLATAELFGNS
jgi:hypothetical protein